MQMLRWIPTVVLGVIALLWLDALIIYANEGWPSAILNTMAAAVFAVAAIAARPRGQH
jgi:hypothetical protein